MTAWGLRCPCGAECSLGRHHCDAHHIHDPIEVAAPVRVYGTAEPPWRDAYGFNLDAPDPPEPPLLRRSD